MKGASAYFKGGIVPYNTSIKTKVLGVDEAIVKKYSVVSTQVAEEMAQKTAAAFDSNFSVAVTGNAGPTKGDSDAEVGTVCIAIATPQKLVSSEFLFSNNRIRTVGKAINKALEMLQNEILEYLDNK